MTLKELQNLVNNVNTMGFEPDEVEVDFKYYQADLNLIETKSVVKAADVLKPKVIINLQ